MIVTRYSKEHEYAHIEGDVATVGISVHAQEQLGDIVFVEVPEVGRKVKAGEAVAVVESVKAASEVFTPLSGEVIAVNEELGGNPAVVNEDAEGKAWLFKLRIGDTGEVARLMDKAAYETFVNESDG